MPFDDRLLSLLARWEELRDRGQAPTPEELCRDCPDRVAEVRSALRDLAALDPPGVADPGPGTTPDVAPAGGADGPPPAAVIAGLRYRPLRFHAKGGQGEVYLARDEGLNRDVALKRVQPRLAGRAEVVLRFLREAEVCGRLQHPGIVPVYAQGRDADDQPYYAMRFIEGESLQDALTRFHADARASERAGSDGIVFRQLLTRFAAACNAVAYAHSQGVVHRDLKPGNIMLGPYGETLVVDWGLAKVTGTEAQLTGAVPPPDSDTTHVGQVVGTPAYMAPEQARGETDRVGPAADIYSLGATLYALLTGGAPFPRPNRYAGLEQAQAGRPAPPRQRNPAIPAALAAVCLKAMAPAPAERYATAAELAADVERWLADEPVGAWREPWGARARRWVRKHARLVTGVAAALLVGVVSLGGGAVLLSAANSRERAARAEAVEQRDTAREQKRRTRQALDTMIAPEMVQRLGTQKELSADQKEFLRTALAYYREFAAEAGTEEEGRQLEADAYVKVGHLLDSLGERSGAEAPYRAAVARQERLVADFPAVAGYRRQLAVSQNNLGGLLMGLGKRAEAEAEYRAALAVFGQLAADFPAVPLYRRNLANSHNNLGVLLERLGKSTAAEAEYRAALALQERLAADFPAEPEYRSELASSHNNLGILLNDLGRRTEAVAVHRAALALRERLVADFPAVPGYRRSLANSHNNLGSRLRELGNQAEAEANHRAALALLEQLAADFPAVPDHAVELGGGYCNFGNLLGSRGELAAALDWFAKAIATLEPVYRAEPRLVTARQFLRNSHWNRANALGRLGRPADALRDWDRALELDDGARAALRLSRADALARAGRPEEAAAAAEELATPAAPAGTLYDCACVLAVASAVDGPDAEARAARAVALLRRAAAAGYRDGPHMLQDADLAPLRRRADYAALLWDLADTPAASARL